MATDFLNSGNTRHVGQYQVPLGIDLILKHSVWYYTDPYVYPTFKNLLNRDYCRLCTSVCRRGAVTMPGLSPDRIKGFSAYQSARGTSYHTSSRQNTPQITYTRASRASVRGTGEAS